MSESKIQALILELQENLGNPDKCREIRKKMKAEEHKIFLKLTKCTCGVQMVDRGDWSKGGNVLGGRCYITTIYQCPECKNVRILHG